MTPADPEYILLDRIATALERIADSLGGTQTATVADLTPEGPATSQALTGGFVDEAAPVQLDLFADLETPIAELPKAPPKKEAVIKALNTLAKVKGHDAGKRLLAQYAADGKLSSVPEDQWRSLMETAQKLVEA